MPEVYEGPKFNTVFIKTETEENEKINELIYWCETFQKNGLTPENEYGTAGNLSFRNKSESNEFIITQAGLKSKIRLNKDNFVLVENCNSESNTVYVRGKNLPSSEAMLHYYIYSNQPEINAVFHGHNDIILSLSKRLNLPVTKNEYKYGTKELAESVKNYSVNYKFFILRSHGFVSVGKCMLEAGKIALDILQKIKNV